MSFTLANIQGRAALVDSDGGYYDVATLSSEAIGPDPMSAIGQTDELHRLNETLSAHDSDGAIGDVDLDAPVPRPRNCFAVGLNYHAHAAEADMELPESPLVFTKFPSCIVGPTADIELASATGDYEAELVVVIGKAGRNIAAEAAWDHVAGVTAGQDISDRALQFAAKPPHFDLGKSRDTYGPTGPVLVSPEQLADRNAISISCDVNDERRQHGSTAQLIFDIPTLIEYLSSLITLAPGDMIFTGTPEGIGATQGKFLKPGDVVSTTIEGIGTLRNLCT